MERYNAQIEQLRLLSRMFPNVSPEDIRNSLIAAADSIQVLQEKVTLLEANEDHLLETVCEPSTFGSQCT